MLVLSRGQQDKIVFPTLGISVEVLRTGAQRVRLGVTAPPHIKVLRGELAEHEPAALAAHAEEGTEERHRLRNQLQVARLQLQVASKQLELGKPDAAMSCLLRALRDFDSLEQKLTPPAQPTECDRKPRALVVDDDENERELLASYLRLCDFDVDEADDGLRALFYLAQHNRPDFVLLDMNMRGLDGAATLRRIRDSQGLAELRVIGVSGLTPEQAGIVVGKSGVDAWFRKPVKAEELVDHLREAIMIPA